MPPVKPLLTALSRAFQSLRDPRLFVVVIKGVIGSIALLAVLVGVAWVLLGTMHWAVQGWAQWLEWLFDVLAGLGIAYIALLLFPPLVLAFSGFLQDDISAAVEARYYPQLPPPRQRGWTEDVGGSVKLALRALGWNILCLPLFFLPIIGQAIWLVINGSLLGREYAETIALRRLPPQEAALLVRSYRGRLTLAGMALAGLALVPFLNMLAPVLGTAFMTHVVYGLPGLARLVDGFPAQPMAPKAPPPLAPRDDRQSL